MFILWIFIIKSRVCFLPSRIHEAYLTPIAVFESFGICTQTKNSPKNIQTSLRKSFKKQNFKRSFIMPLFSKMLTLEECFLNDEFATNVLARVKQKVVAIPFQGGICPGAKRSRK